MAVKWSGLGPELLVRLERDGPDSLTAQLERELREAIRSGRLAAGERLPSSRALARELSISRGLVQECYAQLLAEGFLTTRAGSGTHVASTVQKPPALPELARPAPRLAINFEPGRPDLASFPRQDWIWAMREVSRTAPAAALGYGEPRGSPVLREILAGYLRRVRGAVMVPEQIVVCAGFQQGINLVLRTLSRRGVGLAAFEDPGEVNLTGIRDRWGLDGVPVAVDEDGIDVEELARTQARAAVLTPAHQSPTGVVLAPARRQALAEWAPARDATIIEDDYDAEFHGPVLGARPSHRIGRDTARAQARRRAAVHGTPPPRSPLPASRSGEAPATTSGRPGPSPTPTSTAARPTRHQSGSPNELTADLDPSRSSDAPRQILTVGAVRPVPTRSSCPCTRWRGTRSNRPPSGRELPPRRPSSTGRCLRG